MNKEIFKLEELLKESDVPFTFNWREENRPTPYSEEGANIDPETYPYMIQIGPPVPSDTLSLCEVNVITEKDENRLRVFDLTGIDEPTDDKIIMEGEHIENLAAEQVLEILKDRYEKYKDIWYPKN